LGIVAKTAAKINKKLKVQKMLLNIIIIRIKRFFKLLSLGKNLKIPERKVAKWQTSPNLVTLLNGQTL
jgi:hypothetical protein